MGSGRRKVLLFRYYNRYFPDLSLAAVNSIFRTTNIYKTRRHIVLVRDNSEIDTEIFENKLLKNLTPAKAATLKKIYFPVPLPIPFRKSGFQSAGQRIRPQSC